MEEQIFHKILPRMVRRTVLPSGAEVWTHTSDSRMVTMQLTFPFGAIDDGDQKGIAHFLEHLVLKGSDADGFHSALRPLRRRGCQYNAETWWWKTRFYLSGLREETEAMAQALADICKEPSFDKAQLEKERGVILAELELRAPNEHWRSWFFSRAYPEVFDPYVSIGGTKKSVEAITYEQVRASAEKHLRVEQAAFIAAGGITHEQHLDLVTKLYPEVMTSGTKRQGIAALKYQSPQGEYVLQGKAGAAQIEFHFEWPATLADRLKLGIAVAAIGDSDIGILYARLRSQLRQVYMIDSSNPSWPFLGGSIDVPTTPKDFALIERVFGEVLASINDEGFFADTFEQVMAQERVSFACRSERFGRSKAVDAMEKLWFVADPEDVDVERLAMSTTKDELRELCRTYLHPDRIGIVHCVRPT